MSFWKSPPEKTPDVDIDKDIDASVSFDFDIDVDIELHKDVDINVDVSSGVHVDGNVTTSVVDVEAVGEDTLVEVDVVILSVEDELSSFSGVMVAAA